MSLTIPIFMATLIIFPVTLYFRYLLILITNQVVIQNGLNEHVIIRFECIPFRRELHGTATQRCIVKITHTTDWLTFCVQYRQTYLSTCGLHYRRHCDFVDGKFMLSKLDSYDVKMIYIFIQSLLQKSLQVGIQQVPVDHRTKQKYIHS